MLMSDAANRLSFGNTATATLIGVNCGMNIIRCTPTANRVLTIDRPINNTIATQILIRNLSTAFFIDLTFVLGTQAPGNPTYVGPSSELLLTFDATANVYFTEDAVQKGVVTLTNGVSALVTADVTAQSRITATLKDINAGTLGSGGISIKGAGRVVGTRVGGGGFVITAVDLAGTTVGTDQGIYDWNVSG
jgi:hypothetical protein